MISVSDDFKKAIKSENREIYGYVDVQYQNNNYNLHVSQSPTLININDDSDTSLISNNKVMQKFATLEDNYTLLDGSFTLWNENVLNKNGLITGDVFEDINDTTITIQNNSTTISTKGITIYFKENLPFDFDITFTFTDNSQITNVVRNNTSMVYQNIFETEKYVSQISFEILNVEYPKNRIRIALIDFNLSDFYEGNELIKFEVNEEIDLLLNDIPTNTCSIKLNNYPNQNNVNKFDPINPKGITKYLTNDTTIEPYIGVFTENNGIEYAKLGKFYISDWSSNNDGNVTINGKNLIDKIKSEQLHSDGTFCYNNNSYWTGPAMTNYLNNNTNYTFDLSFRNDIISNQVLKHTEIINYLRVIALCNQNANNNCIFKADRNEKILIKEINNTIVDSISRNNLINDVEYTINNNIKTVSFTAMKNANNTTSTTKDVLNLNYSLNNNNEYIWIPIDNNLISYAPSFPKTFTYTTTGHGTATFIDCTDRMIYIHFVGEIGETFTLHLTTYIFEIDGNITTTMNNSNTGEVIAIDVSEYFRINEAYKRLAICNGIITAYKKYTIRAQTTGDPSLEVGDSIYIQTRYNNNANGYRKMLITKQSFTFDGGLTCELEGVGD